ncbi:hypothetical protein [Enterococcus sp. AZ136]|uniref:hypothetical protein n=1 Tax=Enterococcus sp. AZ136 TaxID=2774788 RepID=UPI003D2821C5
MYDFHGFLDVAETIETDPKLMSNESYRRTGISRAYYASYKVSDEYLKVEYPSYSGIYGMSSHRALWEFFDKSKELKRLEISNAGLRIFDLRKRADYNSRCTISKSDLKLANREAKKIINKIHNVSC